MLVVKRRGLTVKISVLGDIGVCVEDDEEVSGLLLRLIYLKRTSSIKSGSLSNCKPSSRQLRRTGSPCSLFKSKAGG